jgi:hypothetical protein
MATDLPYSSEECAGPGVGPGYPVKVERDSSED